MAGKSGWISRATHTTVFLAAGGVFGWAAPVVPAISAEAPHAEVVDFLPQGSVSSLESVQIRLSQAAVSFGDPDSAAPFKLECEGPVPPGQGRWLDDTRWTFVFESPVPAGVSCVAEPAADFRNLAGQSMAPEQRYAFDTGAPSVADVRPYQGWDIDEDQVFILQFNAPVVSSEVASHSHCVIEGVGESIPVRAVGEEHKEALMTAAYMPQPQDLSRIALLQCARGLPPEAELKLEVGPGVRAVGQAAGLKGSEQAYVLQYEVRAPFTAKLSCTRERAGAPCLPVTPLTVSFSSAITHDAAQQVRLHMGDTVFEAEPLDDDTNDVSYIRFPGPFPAGETLDLTLPAGLRDDAGRTLENADRFPLSVPVAGYPPLAKFASGTFGVVERFANRPPGEPEDPRTPAHSRDVPMVPVTIRNIEAQAPLNTLSRPAGRVAALRTLDDVDVLRWYARLQRLESGHWTQGQLSDIMASRAPRPSRSDEPGTDVRGFAALSTQPEVRQMILPGDEGQEPRPFEVIGIPVEQPGFHVLELESPKLGASLLEDSGSMYVRTGVLVTNLSLHAKRGRDDLLVWVTTLSDASVVPGAQVNVLDCRGTVVASGLTDDKGLWHHRAPIEAPDYCEETGVNGLFISAKIAADHQQAYGEADYAFVLSNWDRGIESWRFNVPTAWGNEPDILSHTVLDRSLYRAGETVGMKHYLRVAQRDGLGIPATGRPTRLIISHEGSSQQYEIPVAWQDTASGGLASVSQFELPTSAHLGTYSLRLTDGNHGWYGSTQFRVEEFRLPTLTGQLSIAGAEQPDVLIAPETMEVGVQLAWMTGGPAAGQQVALSATVADAPLRAGDDDGYSFQPPPRSLVHEFFQGAGDSDAADDDAAASRRLFLDYKEITLDQNGSRAVLIDELPAVDRASQVRIEASYADPVGEIHTLSRSFNVWPGEVQAGLKAESWDRTDRDIPVSLKALGPDLKPRAGVPMELRLIERKTYTVRKRMVGGFYRYDSHTERESRGTVCEAVTDAEGSVSCTIRVETSGAYELVAVATDASARHSLAYTSLWVSGAGDLWFEGQDDDRIDVVPAKREWAAGEDAEFQVRMPFREATALVSVEREGVLWTSLQRLEGKEPLVRVPVSAEWGPNAYVSVLLLRGRIYELPAQSFFQGGWRQPSTWLKAFSETRDEALVTQQIDLAKPAFRLGLIELKVSGEHDRLQVDVVPEQEVARIRDEAVVTLRVALPDGRPAAHGSVAFAVVDEALLELAPNDTWALYEAMHPRRSLAVQTATTQLQVVGRRHYGRKAIAAGGGGGVLPTRELFDTLLSWQPMVALDAHGEATVRFKLNDSLTRFRLVAVADYGSNYFGYGQASVVTRQDMQIISGLPPLVREGDVFDATVTLRNGTEQEREILARAWLKSWEGDREFDAKTLHLKPGETRSVSWALEVPELAWPDERGQLSWRFEAQGQQISDRLAVQQVVEPQLPITTVQASLLPLLAGQSVSVPVGAPPTAARSPVGQVYGGVRVDVGSSLAGSLQGVTEWWRSYPYTCLEQTASQAIALRDAGRWQAVRNRLVSHMDGDGLLRYFPGPGPGSPVLTAYVVAMTHEAAQLGLAFELPSESLARMLAGLEAFSEGRIRRGFPGVSPNADEQRLMAMEALSRHGRLAPELLSSLAGTAQDWSTPAVVEWLSIMTRLPQSDSTRAAQQTARNVLIARMLASGTSMAFTEEPINAAPGLMATPVTSLARLISVVQNHPDWESDLPRMAQGLLAAQGQGAWQITTENLLAPLALEHFSRRFESEPAGGTLLATFEGVPGKSLALPPAGQTGSAQLPWPAAIDELTLIHEGHGRAWVSLRADARVALAEPSGAGYQITRRTEALHRHTAQEWTPGDIYRVELEIHSREGANWVVLDDPVPAGATILGSGLGRDAGSRQISVAQDHYPPAFVERRVGGYRAYFDYLPAGRVKVTYTVRLNSPGNFHLPPSRVEALYRPGLYGLFPNEGMAVQARSER